MMSIFNFRYNMQLSLRVFSVYEYTCMYRKLAKDEKIKVLKKKNVHVMKTKKIIAYMF